MCCHQIVAAEHRIYMRVYICRSFNEHNFHFSELQTFRSELKLFTKLPVLLLFCGDLGPHLHIIIFLFFPFFCVEGDAFDGHLEVQFTGVGSPRL